MNAGNAYAFAGNSPWNFEDPIGLTTLMDMLDPDSDIPSSYGGFIAVAASSSELGAELANVAMMVYCTATSLDGLQMGLDALGFIEPFGAIADGINGGIYLVRGQWGNAAISIAAIFAADALVKPLRYADEVLGVARGADGGLEAGARGARGADNGLSGGVGRVDGGSPTPQSCFVSGTLVITPSGGRAIESLQEGDEVVTYDFEQEAWQTSTVRQTFEHQFEGVMVTLHFGDDEIVATHNHPFWVTAGEGLENRPLAEDVPLSERLESRAGRWIDASNLQEGDAIAGRNEELLVTEIQMAPSVATVYNIEVQETHNYAVGAGGVLVHNKAAAYRPELETPGGLATTEHGMQRLRERGLYNRADDIYRNPTHTTVQGTDGASVYIQRRNGRRRIYDYIVVGDDGIVSALDNIDSQELRELAEQFDWEDWLF